MTGGGSASMVGTIVWVQAALGVQLVGVQAAQDTVGADLDI